MQPRVIPRWVRRAGRLALDRDARADALHEWRRRQHGEPALPSGVRKVVVVCHGNICRSPFAGALLARERPELDVRSAGFAATPGKPAEPAAVRAAQRFGIELGSHGAHRLAAADVAWADLLVGMEGHHALRIVGLGSDAAPRVRLLGDFLSAPPFAIGDPWGRSDEVFGATFERMAVAVRRLAERIGAEP